MFGFILQILNIYVRLALYIDDFVVTYVIILWLVLTYTLEVLKLTQM
jgi:hypothetical protein